MGKQRQGSRTGWKQWTADEARRALREWRDSGLTRTAFAEREGLTTQRLLWWERRLGEWERQEPSTKGSGLRLVPVTVAVSIPKSEASARGGSTVTMQLPGGVVLEFDAAQVSAAWVSAVALEVARAR